METVDKKELAHHTNKSIPEGRFTVEGEIPDINDVPYRITVNEHYQKMSGESIKK